MKKYISILKKIKESNTSNLSPIFQKLLQIAKTIKTEYCLDASKQLFEKLPKCKLKTGWFIYDLRFYDPDKNKFSNGYKLNITNDLRKRVFGIIGKEVNDDEIINSYILYHGWNEINILDLSWIIDLTISGFDNDWMMKTKIPYFKNTKYCFILKKDKFCKRYYEDKNIKSLIK